MSGPWEKYAASPAPAEDGPWAKYQASASEQAAPTQPQKGFLDRMADQPLTSHMAATEKGLATVAQGVGQAVKGAYDTVVKPPETTGEKIASYIPGGLPVYRTVASLGEAGAQATQVPAAVRDINQSPDPLGAYADVAARTAGHAGGQALVAAAAEGTRIGAGKVGDIKGKLIASKGLKAAAEAEPSAATKATAARTTAETNQSVVPKLSQDLHTALDNTAKDAGLPPSQETAASAKTLDVAAGIKKQATALYKQLDQASGGRYQRFVDEIDELKDVIRNGKHIDPQAVAKAQKSLNTVQTDYANLQQQMIQQGTDPALIKAADAKYSQARALEDVSKKIRSAETLNGELKPGSAQLDTGIKNLRPGRFDKALGQHAGPVKQSIIDAGKEIAKQKAETLAAKRSVTTTTESASRAAKEVQAIRGRQKFIGGTLLGGGTLIEGYRRLSGK